MAKANGGFWDKQELVKEIPSITGGYSTKVHICEKDGQKYVDIRKYVREKGKDKGGFTQHTQRGIAIPLENKDDFATLIASLMSVGEAVFTTTAGKKKRKAR